MTGAPSSDSHGSRTALRVRLTVRHPECWIIETSTEADVDVLGRGVYHTGEGRANSHVTLVGDRQHTVQDAVETARASAHTFTVAEMRGNGAGAEQVAPGKASRELLVEHDPTRQVSDALTDRGFVYGSPVDIRNGVEHWTLLTHRDRHEVATALDEVRDEKAADIDLVGIAEVDGHSRGGELPVHRLSERQREVFRLARRRGYYAHPKQASAADLAGELGVTTSTVHEHLHRAEEKLLDRS